GFEEMALFFPVLFLAAAAMAAYVTISRLVATQRPYVGVMLANGYTRGQVLRHYLGYGLLPGMAGSIPGAIAGVLLARLITELYTDL
ncbi:MAG: FtsX-like permease family protein, partial [Actinobacteria bacterium]|nr:FtsX-like permease family protein [Actinomycetota bacterium]NIW31681.1 FtsX-like permease family protein [Actinomycetota bacterium]